MISTVIFDFWQVLAAKKQYSVFDLVKDTLHVDDSTHPYFLELFYNVELGEISERDLWLAFCKHFDLPPPDNLPDWRICYDGKIIFHTDVFAIAHMLKAAGYQIAILSNIDPGAVASIREYTGIQQFDAHFFSYEIGLAKPDKRAYELALQSLNVAAEQAIFIDDREENVVAAVELGIHGIQFEDAPKLEAELQTLCPSLGSFI
jgi:FMN phosphatase YigB (HAD superfamily)